MISLRKKSTFLFALCAMLLAVSCEEYPPEPERRIDRTHVRIVQVDFDSVEISDDWGVKRAEKDVERVSFGTVDGGMYSEQTIIDPVWVETDSAYHLRFTATISVPLVYLGDVYITIRTRFYLASGGWFDYDDVIRTDTYPYAFSETVITQSAFPHVNSLRGFGVLQERIFTRQVGDPRFYWIDLATKQAIEVVSYAPYTPGSNYVVTAEGPYVFMSAGGAIHRWNAQTTAFDTTIMNIGERYGNQPIPGLAASNGLLYVLLKLTSYPDLSTVLMTMDYDGRTIDSVGTQGMIDRHIAVTDSVLFVVDYVGQPNSDMIRRFSLVNMMELEPLIPPSTALEGIAVFGQWFYYVDSWRDSIRRVRLSDLRLQGE